ncbi:TrkH family potassium uptake protein [Parasphaerochaeta coccoides]|uniref:H(+)-transporting two-sector ATPase n=1 Tax=Parasphaerochaeta coccoides (strain ATCC BAA-1237 / DSM 17374 / SPN1) TaxID=760011 RepID=F4GL48_PARC1|nr:potassium transporter TrkG [Parasphaerochaeta coccoides]AEC02388.1 H(+)-transporting two-sector ATPase [Parasphaerochaeta coccoides DSM 17374]
MLGKRRMRISPGSTLLIGFLAIIVLGSILLMVPFSLKDGMKLKYVDSLFISTSSVCVTGLVTVSPGDTFTVFGRTVIALLIQTGGLGFSVFVVFFLVMLGRPVGFAERGPVREALGVSPRGLVNLVKFVMLSALVVETIGAVGFYHVFSRMYPFWESVGYAVFHAVSSFNNAGLDIFPGFESLIPYRADVLLNIMTSALVIIGGLGFSVLREIVSWRKIRRLSTHARIVLLTSACLLVAGTVLLRVAGVPWFEAFFQSVSARTAGFSTIDIGAISSGALLVLNVLMFIGASPGSTGGGIKTTTFFAIIKTIQQVFTRQEPVAFKRRMSADSMRKAFMVLLLALCVVLIGSCLIAVMEGSGYSLDHIVFESISAFATVGLSMGITPALSGFSKVVLIVLMYIGRVGPLTVAGSWMIRHRQTDFIEEQILIG